MAKPSELKMYLYLEQENYEQKQTYKYWSRDTDDADSQWTEIWDWGDPPDPDPSVYHWGGPLTTGLMIQGGNIRLGPNQTSSLQSTDGGNSFAFVANSISNTVPSYYSHYITNIIGSADHESGPVALAWCYYNVYSGVDPIYLLVSRDGGNTYGERQLLPVDETPWNMDYDESIFLAWYLQNNGTLHVVIHGPGDYKHSAWLYTRTDDLGVTWTPYITIKGNSNSFTDSDPAYPGSPYGTGAWFTYHCPRITVNGDKIAVTAIEGFKNYTYEAGWNYPHGYLGYITYDQTITATYQRNDFIICTSMDGGLTWNSAVRILNDENPDRVTGGGSKSWGGAAYYDPGGMSEYVDIGLGDTIYYPWGYSSLAVGAYGDDLYLVSSLYETYKRMGGTTTYGLITDSAAYGPTYSWVYLWYKIPGWTGTPIRGTVVNPGNSMHQLGFVSDEEGETFLVIHGNETEIFELFFNGAFTNNTIFTSDYFYDAYSSAVYPAGVTNRVTPSFPHGGLSSGFAYLF